MELTIKEIMMGASVVLTGLSAGLFYAWQVSVIPGTVKIGTSAYLETMQSINRTILNPAFFLVFFGSLLALGIASIYQYQHSPLSFGLFLAAFILYLLGTFGVTALGNVPLNNQLEALDLGSKAADQWTSFREFYEFNWNRLHLIRTVFASLAFLLSVIGLMVISKGN